MTTCTRITGKNEDANIGLGTGLGVEEGVMEDKEEQHNLVKMELVAIVTLTEVVLVSEVTAVHRDQTMSTTL